MNEEMQIEGHMSWMVTILSGIFDNEKSKIEYVTDLLNRTSEYNEDWNISGSSKTNNEEGKCTDDEWSWENDYNEQNPKYASLFAIHLNRSSLRVFIGRDDEASETLKRLRKMLPKLTGVHSRLFDAMEYAIDALEWNISRKKDQISNNDEFIVMAFQEKWKVLQADKTKYAAVCYLKGSLERDMLLYDNEDKLQNFVEVLEIDPEYHIWYQFAYQKARALRVERSQWNTFPSEQEIMFCQKGTELAPDIALTLFDEAILLKDMFRFYQLQNKTTWTNDISDLVFKCLALLKRALSKATEHGLKKFFLKIKIQITEVMLYQGRNEAENLEGLNILLQCLNEYPTAPVVHQKLGQIYHYGLMNGSNGDIVDFEKARYHFKTGLELNSYKYINCLERYMGLFKSLPLPLPCEEAIQLLTNCLDALTLSWEQDKQVTKIRVWRGCILWIYFPGEKEKRKAACEDWLYVLKNHSEHKECLMNMLWRPPYSVYSNNKRVAAVICGTELAKTLEELRCDSKAEDLQRMEYIGTFLSEIQTNKSSFRCGKHIAYRQKELICNCQRTQFISTQPAPLSSRNDWRTNKGQQSNMCEADLDDNWRVKK